MARDMSIKLNLNADEFIKLLEEAKKKAKELQDIIDRINSAKVETKDSCSNVINVLATNLNSPGKPPRQY